MTALLLLFAFWIISVIFYHSHCIPVCTNGCHRVCMSGIIFVKSITRVSGAKMLCIYRYAPTAVTGYVCRASYDVHRYRFDIQHQPPSLSQLQLCQHCVNVICYKGRRNVLLKWHFLCICPKLPTTSRTLTYVA